MLGRRTGSELDARPTGRAEWRGPDLNRRHHGFQPCALPTELPRRGDSVYPRSFGASAAAGGQARPSVRSAEGGGTVGTMGSPTSSSVPRRGRARSGRSRSSEPRSTSGRVGAASTWGRRRCARPGSRSGCAASATRCATTGTSRAPSPRRRRSRTSAPVPPGDPRDLRAHRRAGRGGGRRRRDSARARGRPFGRAWARSAGSRRRTAPGGVLWIDAHSDSNTPETSPSGNVHGMPLAAALGLAGRRRSSTRVAAARGRAAARRARSAFAQLDDGRAGAPARRRRARVHDERDRPDRDRAGGARGARPGRGRRLRPRLARHGRPRPGDRARASGRRCAAGSRTARRTSRSSSSPSRGLPGRSRWSR